MGFEANNKFGKKSTRKGVSNKSTSELREKINLIINNNLEIIEEDLNSLEPKDRLNVLIQLLKFTLPTLKQIELDKSDTLKDFTFSFGDEPIILNYESEKRDK
jgi:hypothetical protein